MDSRDQDFTFIEEQTGMEVTVNATLCFSPTDHSGPSLDSILLSPSGVSASVENAIRAMWEKGLIQTPKEYEESLRG